MKPKVKLAIGLTAAATVIGVAAYKVLSEQFRPVRYSPTECAERLSKANEIELREVPFTLTKRYNVVVDNEKLATVYESAFSWGINFDIYAGTKKKGKYLGHAKEEVFSIGHKSNVFDENDKPIGKLDEVLLTINPGTLIDIFDSNGNKVGVSDEVMLTMTKERQIYDNAKRPIGSSVKSYFWDNYTITTSSENIDRRVLISLVAMEDKLDDKKEEEERKEKERKERERNKDK